MGSDGSRDIDIVSSATAAATLKLIMTALSLSGERERNRYSACHNGLFSEEKERLWQGTLCLFIEVLLLPGPALGLCSQRTFIRDLLSLI